MNFNMLFIQKWFVDHRELFTRAAAARSLGWGGSGAGSSGGGRQCRCQQHSRAASTSFFGANEVSAPERSRERTPFEGQPWKRGVVGLATPSPPLTQGGGYNPLLPPYPWPKRWDTWSVDLRVHTPRRYMVSRP